MHAIHKGYPIIEPMRVKDASQVNWQASADVVVVGFGGAGASVALEAAHHGANVLILDRLNGGGATRLSGGVVYAGGGTSIQKAAGVEDNVQGMYEYLQKEVQGVVSDETVRAFCEESAANLQWLESHGVIFDASRAPKKTSYPENQFYLYYSGNESVAAYRVSSPPAERGHRAKGKGLSGNVLFEALRTSVQKTPNIKVQYQTAVQGLIIDEDERVIGVVAQQIPAGSNQAKMHRYWLDLAEKIHTYNPQIADVFRKLGQKCEAVSQTVYIRATKGVALCSGGFMFNRQLVEQYIPKYKDNHRLGAIGCDGSALRLGMTLGAKTGQMNKASAWRFINPPFNWLKGIIVGQAGERVCTEECYGAVLGTAIAEKADNKAWLIIDDNIRQQALKEIDEHKYWWFQGTPAKMAMKFMHKKGDSIEQLAQKTGIQASTLKETIDAYNHGVDLKVDPWGKNPEYCQKLTPPFYAIDISGGNKNSPCPVISLGGLRTNEQTGAVLKEDGSEIKGLYAAGRAAVGVASNNYLSGLSIADCVFSGRRVGLALSK